MTVAANASTTRIWAHLSCRELMLSTFHVDTYKARKSDLELLVAVLDERPRPRTGARSPSAVHLIFRVLRL
jgi:hypothetical protein